MRTAEQIQSALSEHTDIVAKLNLEVFLDMRELLVEIKDAVDECKEELVEIKNNTAE
jgi:hypothetical protein